MSVLGTGPLIPAGENADLVCYSDCIEFMMELCTIPESMHFLSEMGNIYELKRSLLRMHKLHLVHKDIKPENILFSETRNKYIYVDFGMTAFIKESFTQRSLSQYEGTLKYSSVKMRAIY